MSPIVSKMDAPIAPWDRPSADLPHLNAEARRFYERKPDFIDIGGDIQEAGLRAYACGQTLMSGPNDNAMADLRAAHAEIGRQIAALAKANPTQEA